MTRDLAALARVWRDLAADASRRGQTLAALVESRYGAVPGAETETETETETEPEPETETEPEPEPVPVPDPVAIIETFAALHGLDLSAVEIRAGDTSRTHTIAPGMAAATYARGADDLATLALALHEAGHAFLRATSTPSTRAPSDPPRWLDEAAAAWAVRELENPALIPDPATRAEFARRRARREAITARLAAFEAAVISGSAVRDAWPQDLDPAHFPQLFDEPGVMAAYAAADRWPQAIVGRKVRTP